MIATVCVVSAERESRKGPLSEISFSVCSATLFMFPIFSDFKRYGRLLQGGDGTEGFSARIKQGDGNGTLGGEVFLRRRQYVSLCLKDRLSTLSMTFASLVFFFFGNFGLIIRPSLV